MADRRKQRVIEVLRREVPGVWRYDPGCSWWTLQGVRAFVYVRLASRPLYADDDLRLEVWGATDATTDDVLLGVSAPSRAPQMVLTWHDQSLRLFRERVALLSRQHEVTHG